MCLSLTVLTANEGSRKVKNSRNLQRSVLISHFLHPHGTNLSVTLRQESSLSSSISNHLLQYGWLCFIYFDSSAFHLTSKFVFGSGYPSKTLDMWVYSGNDAYLSWWWCNFSHHPSFGVEFSPTSHSHEALITSVHPIFFFLVLSFFSRTICFWILAHFWNAPIPFSFCFRVLFLPFHQAL